MKETQRQENTFILVLEDIAENNILGVFKVSVITFRKNNQYKS